MYHKVYNPLFWFRQLSLQAPSQLSWYFLPIRKWLYLLVSYLCAWYLCRANASVPELSTKNTAQLCLLQNPKARPFMCERQVFLEMILNSFEWESSNSSFTWDDSIVRCLEYTQVPYKYCLHLQSWWASLPHADYPSPNLNGFQSPSSLCGQASSFEWCLSLSF